MVAIFNSIPNCGWSVLPSKLFLYCRPRHQPCRTRSSRRRRKQESILDSVLFTFSLMLLTPRDPVPDSPLVTNTSSWTWSSFGNPSITAIMVMAIDTLTRLCPGVLFDWRLYAERGSPRYHHHHTDGKRTDDCELSFLKKVQISHLFFITLLHGDIIIIIYTCSVLWFFPPSCLTVIRLVSDSFSGSHAIFIHL